MELVAEYQLIDEQRREDLHFTGISTEWAEFHLSQEKRISVFAGRQTGKTYNLALRAVRSRYNCVIFVEHQINVILMRDTIVQLSEGMPIIRNMREQDRALIEYDNGRVIDIHIAPRTDTAWRGRRFHETEVMFDEFESFNYYNEWSRHSLQDAAHVVCVGSMRNPYASVAKRWFKSSGRQIYIDAPHEPEFEYVRHELFPSTMKEFVDCMVPIDFYQ